MHWSRWMALVSVVFTSVACGDDDTTNAGAAGSGGTAGSAGAAGSSGSAGSAGSSGSAGSGGSSACGEGLAVGDLAGGSWDDRFSIAGFASRYGIAPAVYDFARDVDGSLVVAGRWDSFSGETVPPLMRLKDGSWQPALDSLPAADDGFSAIAISDSGALALATNDSFGERTGEIWVDDGSGVKTVGAFDGQVRSLAYFGGKLWVAGLFSIGEGATPIEGLATWDGTSWSAPPGGAISGTAFELLVDDGVLYIAGAFTNLGGVAAENVASFDGISFAAHDFPGALAIYALARTDSGSLYAGGAFGEFSEAGGVARWDGAAWQVVGGGLAQFQTRGVVTDLVAQGEVVDATGCFSSAGGLEGSASAIRSPSLARWDGSSWQSLDDATTGVVTPWFQPMVCGDEGLTAIWDVTHQRLFRDGQKLYAGGMFAGVDGVLSQAIAAHDGTSWAALGTSGSGIGGSLDRVAAGGDACSLWAVGTFTHVAGTPAVGRVVKLEGGGWKNFSDTLPKDAWCPELDVGPSGELALGCMIFPPSGDAVGKLYTVEGDALVEIETDAPLGPIAALEWSPSGALFVAGSGIGGFLARVDDGAVTMIEDGFDGGVTQIDVASDDDVVVTGAFTLVGEVSAMHIARWDGATWSALGDGVPGQVTALERAGSSTYVSTYDDGSGAYLLGVFDGTSWSELAAGAAGLTAKPEFNFNAIRAVEGGLIAVGAAELDDGSGRGAVIFRDGAFSAIEGGLSAIGLSDIALTGDAVWIGGSITAAGPDGAVSSVGVARYALPATR